MKGVSERIWSLYVDGSCLGNQNVDADTPAAWAVVIVTGDNGLGKGNGEIHEEFSDIVVTDESHENYICLLYTSPSPRDGLLSRMPSSA